MGERGETNERGVRARKEREGKGGNVLLLCHCLLKHQQLCISLQRLQLLWDLICPPHRLDPSINYILNMPLSRQY